MPEPYDCVQVLELLSEFVDDQLDGNRVEGIRAHLSDCDRCSLFGADFAAMIGAARQVLQVPAPIATELRQRLETLLDQALVVPSDDSAEG